MKKLSYVLALPLLLCCSGEEAPDAVGSDVAGPPMGTDSAATGTPTLPSAPPVSMTTPSEPSLLMDESEVASASGIRPGDPVDLLFVVDNSTSMGDKQAVFAEAIPDLIDMLVHPPCIDRQGDADDSNDMLVDSAEDGSCPPGTRRAFEPITDIHIAVISSSLGAHGLVEDPANPDGFQCPDVAHQNDRAHLIPFMRPEAPELVSDSYQGLGFLVWDPAMAANPPGETVQQTLVQKFQTQVRSVREQGCGFEAPLEAAYRFLVDPAPYESLVRVPCSSGSTENACVAPQGVDQEVLLERANFLRPNSHLVVTFLTDENDCSIKDSGQGYFAMRPVSMARGTAACQQDPNHMCCQSCAVTSFREGCDPDPLTNGCAEPVEPFEATNDRMIEAYNVRCFDQKRRFGMDFLYPVGRYWEGFTQVMLTQADGQVSNPLFASGRSPRQVFVVGIVGTPWQDVVRDPADPAGTVPRGDRLDWSLFLPSDTPGDPFNLEAMGVRHGTHPVTGEVLGGPDTSNTINGFDRDIVSGDGLTDDLQYACTFELPEPRDCTAVDTSADNCDCTRSAGPDGVVLDYATGNPLCLAPDGTYGTTQYRAKAYPGSRVMQLVKDMGAQAVLGSICPRNSTDPGRQDYGYRPPIRALLLGLAKGAA